jgi:hypothetical protein
MNDFNILGNFMMVGKKQLKHLSALGYSRGMADAASCLFVGISNSTNMITVNSTIAIIYTGYYKCF